MRQSPSFLSLLAAVGLLLLPLAGSASAKLEGKAWRELEDRFEELFAEPGEAEAKAEVAAQLLEDGETRAWRLLVQGLEKEAELWLEAQQAVAEKMGQIAGVLTKPSRDRVPKDQDDLDKWQEQLVGLEEDAREEAKALAALTDAVASGPADLREALFRRAKRAPSWAVRGAAAGVAGRHIDEAESLEFLQRALDRDKDPRVRMAALEALRATEGDLSETAESLVLGRLADKEWGVQLLAVRIVDERLIKRAVPHLINGLSEASPRVAEAMGEILQELTGENFEPYADVWARWWEDHADEFRSGERVRGGETKRPPSDVTFYGLPIKSDRVLFIIDISGSMKLETENENPADEPPPPPVTGPGAPPPPPPPEEIMSGPKIDVAKDELKKALKKLPESAMFNIIAFNHAVLVWNETMIEASPGNVDDALMWVRALRASGSTYVDGALRVAFRIAGLGAVDKAYPEVNVDTIVLLSDGAPTDDALPTSNLMDPDVILQHVREWNRYKRVVIHCIGVDMVESIDFLRRLALENEGTYVDR